MKATGKTDAPSVYGRYTSLADQPRA